MKQITDNKNYSGLFFLGDTHGYTRIPKLISKSMSGGVIFHVGDFGVGFISRFRELENLKTLNDELGVLGVKLYVVRGNHDDPKFFKESTKKQSVDELNLENIVLLEDHTMVAITVNDVNKNVYCNGGAVSIDRMGRVHDVSYWSDEKFYCPESDELDKITDVDIIVTHTRPNGVWPYTYNTLVEHFILEDGNLDYDLKSEGEKMFNMFSTIKKNNPQDITHYYGHFHNSFTDFNDNIKHVCLDISEIKEHYI